MKNNIKALELIESGLSSKTVSKLTESQINILHSKLVSEQTPQGTTMVPRTDTNRINQLKSQKQTFQVYEKKLEEEDDFELDADQIYTGQKGPHDANNPADDGMDDDTSPENHDSEMIGMSEGKKKSKKSEPNPWAICHAQVGPKKTRKFERCVMAVKKSLKEGKNPVSLFLENEIMRIVEKHIPPRITKGDLMKYLSEDTKTKPKEKPGTKTPPKEKPHDPFKPSPHKQPKPKAKHETKEAVMDAPAKPKEKPTVKPGTKTPPKEKPFDPFKPSPSKQPAPKAGTKRLPEWLTFKSMGIKFK